MNTAPVETPGKLSVLVVEDSEALRDLVQELLGDAGHAVHLAASSQSALVLLQSGIEVDLIFTDIVLPGGQNGFELVEEARKARPGIKALFMTGHARHQVGAAIKAAGGVLLTKPFRRKDMTAAISEAMAQA